MDQHSPMEHEVRVDIESVISTNEEGSLDPGSIGNQSKPIFTDLNLIAKIASVDDDLVRLNVNEESMNYVIDGKEKRKKASSAKKPPKPPRPQRGFSLDTADQKLIKELAELALIKRARIERMKALMQKKASKTASSSTNGSLFAMICTIFVFIVLLFQGMSCQISCGTIEGSPHATQTNENSIIFINEELNPSAHDSV